MIKTLRITTVLAAFLAAGFFAFPVVFGYRGDEQIEQFLKSPGAVERFNKAKGAKVSKRKNQISPLVKQAVGFGLYLNPPPAPAQKKKGLQRLVSPRRLLFPNFQKPSRPSLSL